MYVSTDKVVAIIVDGTVSGSHGGAYANHWVAKVITIAHQLDSLAPNDFIAAMRLAHKELHNGVYVLETAAYAVLALNRAACSAWAINCGDCRVGQITATNEGRWLTPVHTAANALGECFSREHAVMDARHILTRRLRAQRFDIPEVTWLDWNDAGPWVLATDGYWIDHLLLNRQLDDLEDDASVLSLGLPLTHITQHTDCSNFLTTFV
ncbi:hypothetical protein CAL13_02795 [Bordetella genomosp. 9]|uniref:PPM-type phosphatase domain-containing protein n=1 Tax=Bordetella genomosp. 9 TaxID=1416803 RepID=A0A1W6YVY2_9BORD|nr:hypothetical protein CAL13_02795 [Bordetella genomosp. 9]ARP89249.1 hypothetical protein CAL14_02180 [Bordetella genomosp. 9]